MKPRLERKDVDLLQSQLAAQLAQGSTIEQALERLADATAGPGHAAVNDVLAGVRSGELVSQAMERRSDFFEAGLIDMVRTAERENGAVGELLRGYHKAQREIRNVAAVGRIRLLRSASYLATLGIIVLSVLVVYRIYVLPGFSETFDELGAGLPPFSQMILSGGHWYFLGIVFLVALPLFGTLTLAFAMPQLMTRATLAGGVLGWLPLWGRVARRARTLGVLMDTSLLLQAGVSVSTCASSILQQAGRGQVTGAPNTVAQALAQIGGLRRALLKRLYVGEATGTLTVELPSMIEEEKQDVIGAAERSADRWGTLMLIALAVAIGHVLVAMYLPIFNLGAVT